jgi:hypothetical protein
LIFLLHYFSVVNPSSSTSILIEYDLHWTPTLEVLSPDAKSFENPSAIHLKGNEDAKSPSSHEEATHETKNEAPTVHPDGQTSKSEPQLE